MTAATLDPLADASLRVGHRWLLETFRELLQELEEPEAGGPDAARAAVAFLRHSLLPFARGEEATLAVLAAEAEGAALDHAFIAAEIDRLGDEARAHPFDGARVRRRLHRLEAVLELHLSRDEERDARLPPAAHAGPTATREMDAGEVRAFLRSRAWGVLATVDESGPYAVPVGYGFDGEALYVATGPGRKAAALERGSAACLTVCEVASGDRWRSVVAAGAAVPVEGPLGRALALRHIHRQRTGGPATAADLVRAARARVFRIAPRELTGRVRE